MAKYCPRCGAQADETDKFCLKCGNNLQFEQYKHTGPIAFQPPSSHQSYRQKQGHIQTKSRKKNASILGVVIGIAVIIIVLMILFLFVFNGGNNPQIVNPTDNGQPDQPQNGNGETSKFIGTWNYEYSVFGNLNIIVKSDFTLEVGYSGLIYDAGTWSLNNEEICLTTTEDIFETGSEETTQCFNYSFSNGENTLTLTATGIEDIILTK
jgi:hypothetical protein